MKFKALSLILIILFGLTATEVFSAQQTVVLGGVVGSVSVMKAGTNKWIPGKNGMVLHNGDKIKTAAKSACSIKFGSSNVVKLSAYTNFSINQANYNAKTKQQNTSVSTYIGKVYTQVKQKLKPGSSFSVKTPTAIAGVRSTHWATEVLGDGETNFYCLEGSVEITAEGKSVYCDAGEKTNVEKDKEPDEPTNMTDEEEKKIEDEDESIQESKYPTLEIQSPVEDTETEEDKILVSGETDADSSITINGVDINPNALGKFELSVNLKEGDNTITIIATNKAGNVVTITRKVKKSKKGEGFSLNVDKPDDNITINEKEVQVKGNVSKKAKVTIDEAEITVKDNGDFEVKVKLEVGKNAIIIKAKAEDTGEELTVTRSVTYELGTEALKLTVDKPDDNVTTNKKELQVKGNVSRKAVVVVNDTEIKVKENGDFTAKVALEKGKNTIIVKAKALDTGEEVAVTRTVIYEEKGKQPPILTISTPNDGAVVDSPSVQLKGITEKDAEVTVNGNKIAVASDGSFETALILKAGENLITIISTNTKENLQATVTLKVTYKTEDALPMLTISNPQNGVIVDTPSVQLKGITDKGNKVNVNGNNVTVASDGSFETILTLKEGDNFINVVAVNTANVQATVVLKVTLKMGTAVPPMLTISNPQNGAVVDTPSVQLKGITDKTSKVTVNGNSVLVAVDGSFETVLNLKEGDNFINVIAKNQAELQTVINLKVTFKIKDTIPPILTITSPPNNSLTNQNIAIIMGITEKEAKVRINGQSITTGADGSFTNNFTLVEGINNINIEASDASNNKASQVLKITLDTLPPILTISSPPEAAVSKIPTATVIGISEAGAKIKINGVEVVVSADGSFSYPIVLQQGKNTIKVEAKDKAGNVAVAIRTVSYDSVPFFLTVSSPPDSYITHIPNIDVIGFTTPGATVRVNQKQIYLDPSGSFKVTLPLVEGENSINIDSTNKYGDKLVVVKKVIYRDIPPIPPK
ncbi:MAG: FecR domain-containing protein [Actinobacteria bacterium]|nr:FecR domain-containing protein [Actinomycetota bacterium]